MYYLQLMPSWLSWLKVQWAFEQYCWEDIFSRHVHIS